MSFDVWAPAAGRVDLLKDGRRLPMHPAEDEGWWSVTTEARAGDRYAYSIDGGDPLPDPRSPHQPDGVHGTSAVVDHGAHGWSDRGFVPVPLDAAVIYEMHVGTFTPEGTFDAAIARLDHVAALGATAVELMPVAQAPGNRGWGYDGVDLYAPHHAYGGPAGLQRFVDACHSRGLATIIDVVYNHLGPDGNHLGRFGPYFTDRYTTPWGAAVNLDDEHSDEVRRFFIDNALMWLRDYHFDGLRLDAVHAIFDRSAMHFLEQIATEVHAMGRRLGRELWVIAESDLNDPRLVHRRDDGGFGLDAQWNDDFHHALHAALTGERSGYYTDFGRIEQIAYALRHGYVFDGRYSASRKRTHGRSTQGLPAHRFLAYLQNHDQIGNRARGERTGALMSPDLLKVGAALVVTSPFVPMLFQGEEWGARSPFLYFTDHEDAALGGAVSEGRRREFAAFGWDPHDIPDPQAEETFVASKLDWGELADPVHADLLEWHRQLILLRKAVPELGRLPLEATGSSFDERARTLAYRRGSVTTLCNFAAEPRIVPLGDGSHVGDLVLASPKDPALTDEGVELPAEGVAIFRQQSKQRT